MLVKICGITSEGDALLAVGLGADALGFVFAPSPRQLSKDAVRRIAERVPREILTVGVFRNEAPSRVVEIANSIGLRAVQLHGDETPTDTQWIAERVPLVIKAFPAGHRGIENADSYGATLIMVDADSPGSGEVFDWRLAEGVVDPARLIVAGGLHPGNVADAISHLHPFGVDVSSGVESSPGVKDPRKVRAFVVAARRAAGEDPSGEEVEGLGKVGVQPRPHQRTRSSLASRETGGPRPAWVGADETGGAARHGADERVPLYDWDEDM